MNGAVDEFLASLVGTNNWNPQMTQVREWSASDRIDNLLAVAAALTDQKKSASIDVWVQQAFFDSIARALAEVPGLSQAEAALAVILMPEPEAWQHERPRSLGRWHTKAAAFFAQWQPPDVLRVLFERHGNDARYQEMLACLVQEMALRGYEAGGEAADFWQESVVNTQHPLGWLPTTLLAEEKMFPKYLPQRRLGGSHISWADPGLENDVVDPLPAPIDMKAFGKMRKSRWKKKPRLKQPFMTGRRTQTARSSRTSFAPVCLFLRKRSHLEWCWACRWNAWPEPRQPNCGSCLTPQAVHWHFYFVPLPAGARIRPDMMVLMED